MASWAKGEPSTIGVVWQLDSIFSVLNFTLIFLEAGFFPGVVIILNFLLKVILLPCSLDSEGNPRDFKKQFKEDFRKNTDKRGGMGLGDCLIIRNVSLTRIEIFLS